jgi:low affinity Fe/Cu permease
LLPRGDAALRAGMGPAAGKGAGGSSMSEAFRKFANKVSLATGTPWAFLAAVMLVVVWAVTGPLFHFSEVWQLVINTGTTIVTFLMVFLIQNTQNRDSAAIHLKLDELLRAVQGARNSLVDLEEMSDDELKRLHEDFARLRERADDLADEAEGELAGRLAPTRGGTARSGRAAEARDEGEQLIHVEGLGQQPSEAARGAEHRRRVPCRRQQLRGRGLAAGGVVGPVGQGEIEAEGTDEGQRLRVGRRLDRAAARAAQHLGDERADVRLVVENEDSGLR